MQPQQYPAPQSPMQPAAPKKKRGISEYLTWGLIAAGVVLAISLIAWLVIVLMGKTSSDTGKTQVGAAAVLEPEATAPYSRTINSTLGVQISYNARELEGFGFAEEVTFSNTDLDEARAYTVMRVRPVETSEATRSEVTLESPELRVTSSPNKNYWDLLSTKKEYKDLSKVDMLVKETVTAREKDRTVDASDAEVKNIGDTDYRKVSFTYLNELYGVATERREDCYMTVQQDRPYVACINNIRASNFAAVPELESVLSQMKYENLDKEALVSTDTESKDAAMLENKEDEEVSAKQSDESKPLPAKKSEERKSVPEYLVDTNNFKTAAAATPAVVRIGTVYCADIKLSLPNGGDGPTLTGACIDKAGTGFFISRDGLIATSASTIQVKPQEAVAAYITNAPDSSQALTRLERIVDYLVEARSIMRTDADALIAGVEERNQDIIAKVNAISTLIPAEDIAITKENYGYAVQLADKPMVVNQNGDGSSTFAYTDTVIEAAVEAKSYSTNITQQQIYAGDDVESDTALLKAKKSGLYPTLALSQDGNTIAEKSKLSIAGLPMYAFGSLATAQFRSTPLYRMGEVTQTFNASKGQKTRSIATSSHAGLAGAPVLDSQAKVVGMATYNNLNCPDRKCFASTIVRDTTQIKDLVKQRNIVLQTSSDSAIAWNQAIEALTKGNYKHATQLFNQAGQLYPQNYRAAQFADYSKSQYGTVTDTSTMNTIVSILQMLAVVASGVIVLLLLGKLAIKLIIRPHTETQYGQMAGGQYIDPNQWQHQSITPTPPPQTLAPLSSVPQPTAWQPPQQPAAPQMQPQTPPLPTQPPEYQAPMPTQPPYPPQQ